MLESSACVSQEPGHNHHRNTAVNAMEKNANSKVPPRSGSAGPATGDSKPKTDGKNSNGSKQRYTRKRDPSYPKTESFSGQARRPTPQKGKAFDKRPPQRGGVNRLYGGGHREEVAEAQRAEFSPAHFSGPKKISLNHLLNFTFEPRGHGEPVSDGHGGWGRRNKWGHKAKPFNKELFLQANCQFVVSEDQDYTAHFADPDTLVSWDSVQQVRIYSHEVPSCPICLYPPVAAKITCCGHIFCWACILHYLSLGEKTWTKCPICYEAVHTSNLKSVVAMETRQYLVGDTITMQLMRREKGVLVALPSPRWMKVEKPIHLGDDLHSQYSKLLLASPSQVLQQVVWEERASLQRQYLEEQHTPEACFIEAALQELKLNLLFSPPDDLEKRRHFRQKKAREERRRERRIEMEENQKQGRYPEVHIGLENLQHFPAFGSPPADAAVPLGLSLHSESLSLLSSHTALSSSPASDTVSVVFPCLGGPSPPPCVGSLEDDSHCLSFAQMLRDGKAKADGWPRVTPKKADLFLAPPAPDSDGESDGSDRVPVPSFQNSFSQAFEEALLQLDKGPAEEKVGKKKKKKQKLLFSTSMVHTK
ncbi:UNVERIFIED_CONTAM: hypothetical protein FKN15_064241 [Acipenser sinensis]